MILYRNSDPSARQVVNCEVRLPGWVVRQTIRAKALSCIRESSAMYADVVQRAGGREQPSRSFSCYGAVIATEMGANSSSASPSWKMESVMVVVPAFLPMSLKAQYSGAAGGSMASSEVSATAMPSV